MQMTGFTEQVAFYSHSDLFPNNNKNTYLEVT